MRYKLVIGALPVMLVLSGCAPVDHGFGDAVAYNKAIQTVDPDPQYAEGSAEPGDNGEVATDAVGRYRTGRVKRPAASGASSGGGSLGGGGGSSRSSGPI
ncbi:hypothetical protein [Sphingomicrobium lutaoense]|uniref:Putative membrane protein YgcG n=1 Tax=Sphingomicrobium lutaoense TaxID=515949 RepID=A0A839Z4C0_9SPHN|nr:hypothetical protein [Sphingomicrobium lutaoense]MBB3764693.1 putative membrane protein YgcG [Sphingomicrobium lutaoense]